MSGPRRILNIEEPSTTIGGEHVQKDHRVITYYN